MLEPWRSHYLNAIGVDVYLPRHPLPAAGPSVEPLWDDVGEKLIVDLPVTAEDVQSTQPRAAPVAAIPAIPAIIDEAPRRTPEIIPARVSGNNTPVAQIRLFVAAVDAGILIIDDNSPPAERQHIVRLLANMLFAVERKTVNLTVEQFDWPLPGLRNRQVALDEQAARETLNSFLTKKILSENISTIYLLGDTAVHWVAEDQRRLLDADRPLHWKVSVSAQRVLRDVRLKQRWWQDLRAPQSHH